MSAQTNLNASIVKFVANVFQEECGEDLDWLKPIWRLLTKQPEKHVIPNTMGTSEFYDSIDTNLNSDDYVELVKHMPADMNMFMNNCLMKLREAIIMGNYMQPWTMQLQSTGVEDLYVLRYFLAILFYLISNEEEAGERKHFLRAFTLLTMLIRLWRKSLPSVCIDTAMDIDEPRLAITRYNGESKLPDGYTAIQNLFIYAINVLGEHKELAKLLTNDVLYDISLIVRMPVCFTLGMHITKLCSLIAVQSTVPVGRDTHSCDVESTRIDLAFSWLYHMILNTPPNLQESLCDNVGAALSIFVHMFNDSDELTAIRNDRNRNNVADFVVNMKEHIMYSHWFQKAFSALGCLYSRNIEFAQILVELPYNISCGIIKSMAHNKEYVAEAPEVCGNCLILFNLKALHSFSQEELQELPRFRSLLLYFVFFPFANERIDVEVVPRLLQVVYDLSRQTGAQFCLDLTNYEHEDPDVTALVRNMLNLANILSNHMSLSWRHTTTNQLIIKIWCKFVTISDIVKPRHFKTIVLLIESSNASDLHPCVDSISDLLPYITWVGRDAEIIIRLISTLIRHALNPGSMSHAYVRVLFHAIFAGNMAPNVRHVAYRTASCICNYKDSSRLFRMFRELKLLTNKLVQDIINIYITQDEPVAWKIMHRALQAVEYIDIPQYMSNMLRSFLQMDVLCSDFTADTQLAFFGSMLSIIKYRRARQLIGEGDAEFFNLLNTFLRKSFQTSHCTSQVQFLFLDLVTELRAFMPSTDQWVVAQFERSQGAIMQYLSADSYYTTTATRFAIFREIAKTCGDMALRLKLTPRDELVQLLATQMKATSSTEVPYPLINRYTLNWSTLSLLFGKICLREPRFVALYIDTMHHILRNGQDSEKSMIIEAMSDICTIHIENISIIMPFLMEYMALRSYLQVSACESLLNLLNSGNVRLQRTEYLTLVSLIATEEKTLRELFMKLFEENLLPNNSDLILANFIPMILYLNQVFNHPDYLFDVKEREQMRRMPGIIQNRLDIYITLLKYVTTSDKFQLMLKIATDIVCVLHRRRLPHSLESLNVLTDAFKVIYVIIKTIDDKYDMPNDAVKLYKETFDKINTMQKQPAYLFMNYDSTIKDVLVILLAMLEDIHTVHPSMLQDSFHLIVFMVATFFANVSALILSTPTTSFSGTIKALPVLFKRHEKSFESYDAEIFKF